MSGAGNYCRTDSAVPQSAAGAGPRSSTGSGEWRGWGPWGVGGGGGGGGDTIGGGGGGWWPRTREHIYLLLLHRLGSRGRASRIEFRGETEAGWAGEFYPMGDLEPSLTEIKPPWSSQLATGSNIERAAGEERIRTGEC